MSKNFKLIIEYDGTDYHGWQRQKTHRSIQETIEGAIAKMIRQPVKLIGSGRTDAGVHARAQTASFSAATTLSPETLLAGLNSLLPDDIFVHSCAEVEASFHARYDVKRKTYHYYLANQSTRPVIGRQYAWHIRPRLDIGAMAAAVEHIRGEHDFRAFEGTGSPRAHTVRNVYRAALDTVESGNIVFDICANGFLRYMVRNLMGTLVEVGRGKMTAEQFKTVLEDRDRSKAGATAPPHGLFLMEVVY